MKELKLFIWENNYFNDYTPGSAVVIAESKDEAIELLKKDYGYYEGDSFDKEWWDEWLDDPTNGITKVLPIGKFVLAVSGGS